MLQFGNELVKSNLDFINFSTKKNILQKRIYISLNPIGVLHIKTVETCHQGHNSIKDMVGRMEFTDQHAFRCNTQ